MSSCLSSSQRHAMTMKTCAVAWCRSYHINSPAEHAAHLCRNTPIVRHKVVLYNGRKTVVVVLYGLHSRPDTVFYILLYNTAFSALTLLVGRQEGHPACKKNGGWWRWALLSPDGWWEEHLACKTPVPLLSNATLPKYVEEEKWGKWLTRVVHEKGP